MAEQRRFIPPTRNPMESKWRLLLFAFVVFGLLVGTFVSGWFKREDMQALGGRMLVETVNESPERLRVDLFVGEQFATLELDTGERGLVRFSPREPAPLELRTVRRNNPVQTIVHGEYTPGQEVTVSLVMTSAEDVRIEEHFPPGSAMRGESE